jgi:catechol 2,3-dioxygenase-like lactoylglutathione lyase family enzyme
MLNDAELFGNVAVKDLEAAEKFYSETLGLKQLSKKTGVVATYESKVGKMFVYQSGTAGTGQATCITWKVADIDSTVADLKSKGVTFEKYDIPGATMDGDVHIIGPMKAAWFKDPDGNVLSLTSSS